MSNLLKVRTPAWSGLGPVSDAFTPIEVPLGLERVLGTSGRVRGRSAAPEGTDVFFQFFPENGEPPLFLKVVDDERLAQQLAADRIAAWLFEQGVATSRVLPDYPRRLPDGRLLLGYRLIEGRPPGSEGEQLDRLGHTLARMHRCLRALPWRDEIRLISRRRDRAFRRARLRLLERPGLDPELRELLLTDATDLPAGAAQPLHGDLNQGNVLFQSSDLRPVLLDFEDAVHNHHSVSVDLAMAVERFVLVPFSDDAQALAAGERLLSGYRRLGEPNWPATGLAALLRTLAVRALVLLGMGEAPVDPNEQRKFVRLIRQTHERAALLGAIERL